MEEAYLTQRNALGLEVQIEALQRSVGQLSRAQQQIEQEIYGASPTYNWARHSGQQAKIEELKREQEMVESPQNWMAKRLRAIEEEQRKAESLAQESFQTYFNQGYSREKAEKYATEEADAYFELALKRVNEKYNVSEYNDIKNRALSAKLIPK